MASQENEQFKHRELTQKIIGVFYEVYNELGFGFLESVYENSLSIALRENGFEVQQQIGIPVRFRGAQVGIFEADILVNRCVFLELKAVRAIDPAHIAQLMNYLKATEIEVGLLLNFGSRPEFKRLAFSNDRKGRVHDGNTLIGDNK
jgi:GxxExxY protein